MVYHIHYADVVIKEHISRLPNSAKKLIQKAIEERLTVNPRHFGKPLRYSYNGHRCLRVSNYRVIYHIDEQKRPVFVVAIGHRKDIYDE